MATENIMMDAVKRGGDRQELHEKIRVYSMQAGKNVKELGLENNLLDLIASDEEFNLSKEELEVILKPENFVGRAKEQVDEFIAECVKPILDEFSDILGVSVEINV